MQILTPSGYVDIIDLNIGDDVIAYDISTGAQIINHLEGKTLWTPEMYPAEYTVGYYDEDGNYVDPALMYTSYEVFQRIHGDWVFYRINNTWDLFREQSVWANMNVVHASDLQIGDILYNDVDGDVIITSIEEVELPSWWKLDVSGDSSYIADGLTLHNASRYWVGGGSSTNWNATANTNWSASSGGANNASVPTSADVANFDGLGNTSSVISAIITIGGLIIDSAYTATITHNAVLTIAGSVTLGANYTIAGTSDLVINAASTITSNGKTWPNGFVFSVASATITLVGNLTINGTFYAGAYNGAIVIINKTTSEKLILNGSISGGQPSGPNYVNGTVGIDMYGSSWIAVNFGAPFTNYGTVALTGTYIGAYGGFTNLGTINAGTSTFQGNGPNFNSGGAVFNNFNTGYGTLTLTSNLTINGLLTNGGNQNINKTTNEVVYVYGGLTQTSENQTYAGTATIILKGGTWTAGTFVNAPFAMPITIDGNISMGGSLRYGGSLLTYVSGVITRITTATLELYNSTQTLTFNAGSNMLVPMTFAGGTKTLLGNFSTAGLVSITASTVINKTTTETLNLSGGVSFGNNIFLTGTTKLIASGGDFASSAGGGVQVDMDIAGNITINSNLTFNGTTLKTLTYVSGTVTGAGNLGINGALALNLNGVTIPNITMGATSILTSNLTCNTFVTSGGAAINKTTTQTVTVNGNITIGNNGVAGTAEIIAKGGIVTTGSNSFIANSFTLDGNLTFAGSILYIDCRSSATLKYLSGTNNCSTTDLKLIGGGTVSFDTSGVSWKSLQLSVSFTPTFILISNLNVIGATTVSAACNVNTSTSARLITGGLIVNAAIGGTAVIELTGGTWSSAANVYVTSPLTFNGNPTISGNVYYSTGTLGYISGTPVVTGSTLNVNANTTFNTGLMRWNNINMTGGTAHVLTSDLYALGTFVTGVGGGSNMNTSNGSKFYIYGGATGGNQHGGNVTFVMRGGTLSFPAFAGLASPVEFDGDVIFQTSTLGAGYSITYVSGTVNTAGSTLSTGSGATMNTRGILWNNVSISQNGGITLTSDMFVNGLLSTANLTAVNKTTNEVLYARGGYSLGAFNMQGNGTIALQGGTWSGAAGTYTQLTLLIDGDVTLGTNANIGLNGTLVYKSGRILSGTLNLINNCTVIDFHKCPIPKVIVTVGVTVTMNQFFTGTPTSAASIVASTTVGQYTIAFTDSFERIGKDVIISGCVLSRPMQLILSLPRKINSLRSTNNGIRYANQSPNGFSKNTPTVTGLSTGPAAGLMGDPSFAKQL